MRVSHATGASRRSGERVRVLGSPRGEAPRERMEDVHAAEGYLCRRARARVARRVACAAAGRPGGRNATRRCSRDFGGGRSGRCGPAGRAPSPATAATRTRSIWACATAASGRRPTPARRGRRSSTSSRRSRSARSQSRRRIRKSSTSAAARDCTARTCRSATASTNRPTPDERGRISGCATRSRSLKSPSIRATPIACSSRSSAIRTDRIPSAAIYRSTDGGRTFTQVLHPRREHRRPRRRHRSVQPGDRLRDLLGGSPGSVGERCLERHGRRHLQIHRRRDHLAAAHERPAAGPAPCRDHHRAEPVRSASTRSWRRPAAA